ncbi:MAG: aminoglycoside/choline kinase family phosphotransferase [Halieaceae bacterium]|jgi:aminoglycoside/choline kinase family phosphotransferase
MKAFDNDPRQSELIQWICDHLGEPLAVEPASSDASFRRYFRVIFEDRSLIAMDAPPLNENCRPFVEVDQLLASGGINVPEILLADIERGYLLLEDLGEQIWLDVLSPDNADEMFGKAIATLIALQQIQPPAEFPVYDQALLRRELSLFPDWYIRRHLQLEPDAQLLATLAAVDDQLVANALAQPTVLVHRDYMPRNLMVSQPNPGVIDFQDAVLGPICYDVVSLFRDAFLSWPEARVRSWLELYWRQAKAAGLSVPEDFVTFMRWADLMGAQRHLKVIGIFARICHRDGKPRYVGDTPRFFEYLRIVSRRYPDFVALRSLLEQLDEWQLDVLS